MLGAAPVAFFSFFFLIALIFAAFGFALFVWTVRLFRARGRARWRPGGPPKKFVPEGPYCHAHNPMITGVLFVMIAEAIFLNSRGLVLWAALFFAINTAYFILGEEGGLERRFGETYRRYQDNVPRWFHGYRPGATMRR